MGQEERTSHKQNSFKYALIASVLFAIAVLLQIYSIFQIAGGGKHLPVFKIFLERQAPLLLAYIFVVITLVRGKRDLLPIIAVVVLGFASVSLLFTGAIMSSLAKIFLAVGRLSVLTIIVPACTNCGQEAKALAKRLFFAPALFITVISLLGWLFFWGGSPLSALMEAAGILLTCNRNRVPCLMIKAVSDGIEGGAEEFKSEILRSSKLCLEITDRIIHSINQA